MLTHSLPHVCIRPRKREKVDYTRGTEFPGEQREGKSQTKEPWPGPSLLNGSGLFREAGLCGPCRSTALAPHFSVLTALTPGPHL